MAVINNERLCTFFGTSCICEQLLTRCGSLSSVTCKSTDWLGVDGASGGPFLNPLSGLQCLAHRRGAVQLNDSLRPLTLDSEDDSSLGKRKKRGSIFFRKKRGKEKDKENKKGSIVSSNHHQFVSVCYSNSTLCDVCNKLMANKAALRCENCLVTVHEHSCKDQVSNCSRVHGHAKMNIRPVSLQTGVPSQLQLTREWPVLTTLKPPASGILSSPSLATKESRKQHGGIPLKPNLSASLSPNIPNLSSPSSVRKGYIPCGYSQWRRVASKLGVNKVISEERDIDNMDDVSFNIIDVYSASMESLDEGTYEANLDDEPELKLTEEEPETWNNVVDKKILKKLKEKDIKRQENIYEFIITEKHHCLTLKIMQKIFAQGMLRELHMTPDLVERIFPCLQDIIDVHMSFLRRLRERQKQEAVIEKFSDLLLEQFQGESGMQLKASYGEFCSRHKEAVSLYKDIFKSDRKFQTFIKKCSLRPLCKARGIPECILLVTQRITKYPLLIESLIKSSKENKEELNNLIQANNLVKDILANVNAQVAEKEKEQRLLEIYNKIDAKSATVHKGKKFKKSDILSCSRKLRHDGTVCLKLARGKVIEVTTVVLSDVIVFLQDNNQKYSFVTHDNKPGVISLQKLLVREKAGQDNRGIYLISSNPSEPEMYEVICSTPKHKKLWMDAIRSAVDLCPEDESGILGEYEEERKVKEAKSAQLRELTASLHSKDRELALICEDKMRILGYMMELVGKEDATEPVHYLPLLNYPREGPETKDMLLAAVQEASRLASTLYVTGTNLSRSVSSAGEHQSEAYISPTLPKRAETFGGFDNPNKEDLPKAVVIKKKQNGSSKDTASFTSSFSNLLSKEESSFGSRSDLDSKDSDELLTVKSKEMRRASGPLPTMDYLSPIVQDSPPVRRSTITSGLFPVPFRSDMIAHNRSIASLDTDRDSSSEHISLPSPPLMPIGREQLATTIQLSHYLNTLMCVFSQHFTNVEILRAELAKAYEEISKLTKESGRDNKDRRSLYRPNQQLEELRNLQEQLTEERTQWQKEREIQERSLDEKRQELLRLQETLKADKDDVKQQRDHLYRQLEALQRKGIFLSPNFTVVSTASHGSVESSGDSGANAVSPPFDASSYISPTSHRRSMSFDLEMSGKDDCCGELDIDRGNSGTSSITTSPTQTMESVKHKSDIKSRLSSANLTSLTKRDLPQALNINLYSATNQQRITQNLPVRQQLPLKLAASRGTTHSTISGNNNNIASKSNSFSGVTANESGLSHVLNTFPHLRGHAVGSNSAADNSGNATVAIHGSSSPQSPSGSSTPIVASHPQSYLHGRATPWYNPSARSKEKDSHGSVTSPTSSPLEAVTSLSESSACSKNKDKTRRDRDPETNEEIIFF